MPGKGRNAKGGAIGKDLKETQPNHEETKKQATRSGGGTTFGKYGRGSRKKIDSDC